MVRLSALAVGPTLVLAAAFLASVVATRGRHSHIARRAHENIFGDLFESQSNHETITDIGSCGCDECTDEVLDTPTEAGGNMTCRDRIIWLMLQDMNETDACQQIAAIEYPAVCAPCACSGGAAAFNETEIPILVAPGVPTTSDGSNETYCGCDACSDAVLGTFTDADHMYTCRDRIEWLISRGDSSEKDACYQVAAVEYESLCGPCSCEMAAVLNGTLTDDNVQAKVRESSPNNCGCAECNSTVLAAQTDANGTTCRDRIEWLVTQGSPMESACLQVAGIEYATSCGPCACGRTAVPGYVEVDGQKAVLATSIKGTTAVKALKGAKTSKRGNAASTISGTATGKAGSTIRGKAKGTSTNGNDSVSTDESTTFQGKSTSAYTYTATGTSGGKKDCGGKASKGCTKAGPDASSDVLPEPPSSSEVAQLTPTVMPLLSPSIYPGLLVDQDILANTTTHAQDKCDDIISGEGDTSGSHVDFTLNITLILNDDLMETIQRLEAFLREQVGPDLAGCFDTDADTQVGRRLEDNGITNVIFDVSEDADQTEVVCSEQDTSDSVSCHLVQVNVTIYYTTEISMDLSQDNLQSFLESYCSELGKIEGIEQSYCATMNVTPTTTDTDNDIDTSESESEADATDSDNEGDTTTTTAEIGPQSVSPVAVSGIALASLVFIGATILVARKAQQTSWQRSHHDLEEYDDSMYLKDGFEEGLTVTTADHSERRQARVHGEADSVISNWSGYSVSKMEEGPLLRTFDEDVGLTHFDDHVCQTLPCEVCEQRRIAGFLHVVPTSMPGHGSTLPRTAKRTYNERNTVQL